MKPATLICFLLFLAGIVIFLIQIWLQAWSPELFLKIIVTDAALFVVSLVAAFLIRENRESEKIHKGNQLE